MAPVEIKIDHLARLAAMQLREDERPGALRDLKRIIEMVDRMRAVDVEGVSPLAHPLDAAVRLRPDEVTETVDREHYQGCAPVAADGASAGAGGRAVRDGLYIVPRAVE